MAKGKIIFTGVCSAIMLLIGIGGPFLLKSIINSQVDDQVEMKDNNQGLWA